MLAPAHPRNFAAPLPSRGASRAARPRRGRAAICLFASTLALLCAVDSGCSFFNGESSINYANTAKGNYDQGMVELKKANWLDAIKLFQYTKSKFGFSKWATLAELGIADANVGREKYQEAVEGYRSFMKNHPTHERTVDGYAAFKVGEAFYKEIPSEWFMVPPAHEKDQGPVRDALRELATFITEYSDSPYADKAKVLEEDCIRRLAEHELYVANFYFNKNHPNAAIGRLEGLVRGEFLPRSSTSEGGGQAALMAKAYMSSKLRPEVLLQLGKTYLEMGRFEDAHRTFEQLIAEHPDDYHAKKSKLYLDYMAKRAIGGPGTQKPATEPQKPAEAPKPAETEKPNPG